MEVLKPRYYSVKEIKQLEHCGKDRAYEIAKMLPHEKTGRDILVFAEDYETYYQEKRAKAQSNVNTTEKHSNIYQIRKFS